LKSIIQAIFLHQNILIDEQPGFLFKTVDLSYRFYFEMIERLNYAIEKFSANEIIKLKRSYFFML